MHSGTRKNDKRRSKIEYFRKGIERIYGLFARISSKYSKAIFNNYLTLRPQLERVLHILPFSKN